jgi:hypothetical protein
MNGWSDSKWSFKVPQLAPVQDEAYRLVIDDHEKAVLTSKSLLGMLNGLETFSQLFTELSPVLSRSSSGSSKKTTEVGNIMINTFYDELSNLIEKQQDPSIKSGLVSLLPASSSSSSSHSSGSNGGGRRMHGGGLIIQDMPALPWRGLLIDTARHFIPLSLLVSNLDTMKAVKLNVLHLHLSDSQSFPILFPDDEYNNNVINTRTKKTRDKTDEKGSFNHIINITQLGLRGSFPIIQNKNIHFLKANKSFIHNYDEFQSEEDYTEEKKSEDSLKKRSHNKEEKGKNEEEEEENKKKKGATNINNKSPNFSNVYGYTIDDFRILIKEASYRGIRVIPEVDVPAHSLSWSLAFPQIISKCEKYQRDRQSPTDIPALNPMKNETYDVIETVIGAIVDIFPDDYIHLGADEVI